MLTRRKRPASKRAEAAADAAVAKRPRVGASAPKTSTAAQDRVSNATKARRVKRVATRAMVAAKIARRKERQERREHESYLRAWENMHGKSALRRDWPGDTRVKTCAVANKTGAAATRIEYHVEFDWPVRFGSKLEKRLSTPSEQYNNRRRLFAPLKSYEEAVAVAKAYAKFKLHGVRDAPPGPNGEPRFEAFICQNGSICPMGVFANKKAAARAHDMANLDVKFGTACIYNYKSSFVHNRRRQLLVKDIEENIYGCVRRRPHQKPQEKPKQARRAAVRLAKAGLEGPHELGEDPSVHAPQKSARLRLLGRIARALLAQGRTVQAGKMARVLGYNLGDLAVDAEVDSVRTFIHASLACLVRVRRTREAVDILNALQPELRFFHKSFLHHALSIKRPTCSSKTEREDNRFASVFVCTDDRGAELKALNPRALADEATCASWELLRIEAVLAQGRLMAAAGLATSGVAWAEQFVDEPFFGHNAQLHHLVGVLIAEQASKTPDETKQLRLLNEAEAKLLQAHGMAPTDSAIVRSLSEVHARIVLRIGISHAQRLTQTQSQYRRAEQSQGGPGATSQAAPVKDNDAFSSSSKSSGPGSDPKSDSGSDSKSDSKSDSGSDSSSDSGSDSGSDSKSDSGSDSKSDSGSSSSELSSASSYSSSSSRAATTKPEDSKDKDKDKDKDETNEEEAKELEENRANAASQSTYSKGVSAFTAVAKFVENTPRCPDGHAGLIRLLQLQLDMTEEDESEDFMATKWDLLEAKARAMQAEPFRLDLVDELLSMEAHRLAVQSLCDSIECLTFDQCPTLRSLAPPWLRRGNLISPQLLSLYAAQLPPPEEPPAHHVAGELWQRLARAESQLVIAERDQRQWWALRFFDGSELVDGREGYERVRALQGHKLLRCMVEVASAMAWLDVSQ